jgi:2-polyprenyl-3-methyl-5-hydroxy-6-metoxy-1,4-benzoquinol methylase
MEISQLTHSSQVARLDALLSSRVNHRIDDITTSLNRRVDDISSSVNRRLEQLSCSFKSLEFLDSPNFRSSTYEAPPDQHEGDLDDWIKEFQNGKEGVFDGIDICNDPDVFPAEKGATSRDIALAIRELQHYHERLGTAGGRVALDMGCGNGALGLVLASLSSFDKVIAVDNHDPAVENAEKNRLKSKHADKIEVLKSDLLDQVPKEMSKDGKLQPTKFDLIVFNHPYYPREGDPVFGLGRDGGKKLVERFFEAVEPFINDNTEIIMPYSDNVDPEHNPAAIAERLGFSVSVLRKRIDCDGVAHIVYRFVKNDVFEGNLPAALVQEIAKNNLYQPATEAELELAA